MMWLPLKMTSGILNHSYKALNHLEASCNSLVSYSSLAIINISLHGNSNILSARWNDGVSRNMHPWRTRSLTKRQRQNLGDWGRSFTVLSAYQSHLRTLECLSRLCFWSITVCRSEPLLHSFERWCKVPNLVSKTSQHAFPYLLYADIGYLGQTMSHLWCAHQSSTAHWRWVYDYSQAIRGSPRRGAETVAFPWLWGA